MASQGPLSPGTLADDAAHGSVAWSSPGNAVASDNTRASATLTAATSPTHYLKATNFGFSIPSGSTIDGIVVEVERRRNGTGNVEDDRVRIVKADGTVGATDKAVAGDYTATEAYVTYGSSTDKWGETWTVADINDPDFGMVFASRHVSGVNPAAQVDHIRITVHYTAGGGTTHDAAGVATGVATVAGAAAVDRNVAGVSAGVATVAGAAAVDRNVAGVASGLCGVSGAAVLDLAVAGVSAGGSTVSGTAEIVGQAPSTSKGDGQRGAVDGKRWAMSDNIYVED